MSENAIAKVTKEQIQHKIYRLRGHNVMLDSDLAVFYGEKTRIINQARSRHERAFEGQAFQITPEEWEDLRRSQNLSGSSSRNKTALPWVYTERGSYKISVYLTSQRAEEIFDLIMDAFLTVKEIVTGRALSTKGREMDILSSKMIASEKEMKGGDVVIYNVQGNLYIGSNITSSVVTNDLEAIARIMNLKEQAPSVAAKDALHQAAEALRDKDKDKGKIMKAIEGINTVMDSVTKSDAAYAILLPAYEMLKHFL